MNNPSSAKPLSQKVAVITGAGRGIGQAIAKAYALAGANVVCAARTMAEIEQTAKAIQAEGGEATAIITDVTDQDQVERLFEQTVQVYGGVDIVLINAGGNFHHSPVDGGKVDDWIATIDLNLMAAFYCARSAIPYLKKRGTGKILTMGSGMGHRGMAEQSAYCVSKAGLWMLVQSLALELRDDNISVNEIIPGPVNSALTQSSGRDDPDTSPFAIAGEWVKEPKDVVNLALFLACQPDYGPSAQSYSLMRRL